MLLEHKPLEQCNFSERVPDTECDKAVLASRVTAVSSKSTQTIHIMDDEEPANIPSSSASTKRPSKRDLESPRAMNGIIEVPTTPERCRDCRRKITDSGKLHALDCVKKPGALLNRALEDVHIRDGDSKSHIITLAGNAAIQRQKKRRFDYNGPLREALHIEEDSSTQSASSRTVTTPRKRPNKFHGEDVGSNMQMQKLENSDKEKKTVSSFH